MGCSVAGEGLLVQQKNPQDHPDGRCADGRKARRPSVLLEVNTRALSGEGGVDVEAEPRLLVDDAALALAAALSVNTKIRSLNLGDNWFGNEGIHAISQVLRANSSLSSLNLSDNRIGLPGIRSLSRQLQVRFSPARCPVSFRCSM